MQHHSKHALGEPNESKSRGGKTAEREFGQHYLLTSTFINLCIISAAISSPCSLAFSLPMQGRVSILVLIRDVFKDSHSASGPSASLLTRAIGHRTSPLEVSRRRKQRVKSDGRRIFSAFRREASQTPAPKSVLRRLGVRFILLGDGG